MTIAVNLARGAILKVAVPMVAGAVGAVVAVVWPEIFSAFCTIR